MRLKKLPSDYCTINLAALRKSLPSRGNQKTNPNSSFVYIMAPFRFMDLAAGEPQSYDLDSSSKLMISQSYAIASTSSPQRQRKTADRGS
jgi:hypothetical protein